MKTFDFEKIRLLDVKDHIKKKGQFNYLSWSYALDILLQQDPTATWEFLDAIYFNETVMVQTRLTAFGKTVPMQLPVMDMRNQAIKNPDSNAINKGYMRCLTKNIACFGIGLHIYEGDDLPMESVDVPDVDQAVINIQQAKTAEELLAIFTPAYLTFKKHKPSLDKINEAKNQRKKELENASTTTN